MSQTGELVLLIEVGIIALCGILGVAPWRR